VAQAAADWRANVVVHAAGVPAFGALASIRRRRCRQVLQANLLAPMRLTQALLPALLRQPRAQVVFVGSALGRIGLPGFSVYGASKAGLHGFAEALRRELADTRCACRSSARAARAPASTAPQSRPTTRPPARRWTRPRSWPPRCWR
jgi:short-subunit dehydrogenase